MQYKTMNDNKYTLGNYIADLRLMRSEQSADVAKKINISTTYLKPLGAVHDDYGESNRL